MTTWVFGGVDDEVCGGVGVDFAVGGFVGAPSVPMGSVVADYDLYGDGWVGLFPPKVLPPKVVEGLASCVPRWKGGMWVW